MVTVYIQPCIVHQLDERGVLFMGKYITNYRQFICVMMMESPEKGIKGTILLYPFALAEEVEMLPRCFLLSYPDTSSLCLQALGFDSSAEKKDV